ncbi:MAG: hypothetical protein A2X61_11825 [Ignavibacteria bacterium GWB2_35_12]|nr:MAG: hypothetical protein A2X61_11825 [Ignavibacteria bacterium GWB2_35_12]OGU96083.1 MAG: hypothetical protein A2220_14870 [Ignavibacteria bacterium RIFOXYA2_FULL_35_10]OGV24456.1 MAG: hypothetical protein A2475_12775 [Ignavibacteria bacterium RIFOXYC2_FULL_35_21]
MFKNSQKYCLLIIIVFSLLYISTARKYTRESDSLELVKFYQSTNGDNWEEIHNWLTPVPINQWDGVVVKENLIGDDTVIVVNSIYLIDNNLTGNLPELNLPDLEILYLAMGNLSGTIPSFNLPSLKELTLLELNLTGEIPVLNLPNLQLLNLRLNKLSGKIPDFNLPKLRSLYLTENKLSGELPIFNLPVLNYFDIQVNRKLSGAVPVFNTPKLDTLLIGGCSFSEIPNLSVYPYLNKISVAGNKLIFKYLEKVAEYNNSEYEFQDTIIPIIIEKSGNGYLLTVNTEGTSNVYQWMLDNVEIPNANGISYFADSTGNYKCRISNTIAELETLFTENVYIKISPVDELREQSQLNLKIFYEPNNNFVIFKYYLNQPSHINLTIYDMLGNVVSQPLNEDKSEGNYSINYNYIGIAKGIYIYSFQTIQNVETGLLYIQ